MSPSLALFFVVAVVGLWATKGWHVALSYVGACIGFGIAALLLRAAWDLLWHPERFR
jgi:hypothetical protein